MKRYPFCLTLLLAASLTSQADAAVVLPPEAQQSYARTELQELADRGVMPDELLARPQEAISREHFIGVLARALSLELAPLPAEPTFTDMPADHPSYPYIEAAVKAGLVQGVGSGRFGTGLPLDRESMVVLYVRALGLPSGGKGSQLTFTDKDAISPWALDAVGAAVEYGLISGFPDHAFRPQGITTLEQAASVTARYLRSEDTAARDKEKEEATDPSPAPVQPGTGSGSPASGGASPAPSSSGGGSGSPDSSSDDDDDDDAGDTPASPQPSPDPEPAADVEIIQIY
ncbi:S-layer homology domain-containing protein [Paenibacillus mucilaginosus]|uniref:S-layer domain protein n=1 Tax=Paenibacillus mucilaginosus (strain KNP414) TaxID=1036673 RepID=F8FG90_PAEMK|nr:S-layer homology domain-containing protein [Paenibacillus mucilaginosus]AEI43910.1 S-layer domain protein [Paenibacillus mucilaginosus KNP414]MCG7212586.1 S-layer homology domain-containing protein [Paenibacillus mucilaginosus]WDM25387.1 S-layer homology domain-containing protein [Paenibacillus mucilaginosus]